MLKPEPYSPEIAKLAYENGEDALELTIRKFLWLDALDKLDKLEKFNMMDECGFCFMYRKHGCVGCIVKNEWYKECFSRVMDFCYKSMNNIYPSDVLDYIEKSDFKKIYYKDKYGKFIYYLRKLRDYLIL